MACFVMSTLKQSLAVCHTLIIPIVSVLMRISVRNHFAKVTSTSSYSSNCQSKSKVTCKIGKMTCKIGQGYSTFPSTILVLSFVHGHLIYSLRSCCTLLGCEVNYLSFCNYQSYSVYKTFTIFFYNSLVYRASGAKRSRSFHSLVFYLENQPFPFRIYSKSDLQTLSAQHENDSQMARSDSQNASRVRQFRTLRRNVCGHGVWLLAFRYIIIRASLVAYLQRRLQKHCIWLVQVKYNTEHHF